MSLLQGRQQVVWGWLGPAHFMLLAIQRDYAGTLNPDH